MLKTVMSTEEAASSWSIGMSTLRNACNTGLIESKECDKSGGRWNVTIKGMNLRYGTIENRILQKKHKEPLLGLKKMVEYKITSIESIMEHKLFSQELKDEFWMLYKRANRE